MDRQQYDRDSSRPFSGAGYPEADAAGWSSPAPRETSPAPERPRSRHSDIPVHGPSDHGPAADTSGLPAGAVGRRATESGHDAFVVQKTRAPRTGWWRNVDRLLGGAGGDRDLDAQLARVRQTIRSDYRIAFLSLKGGVGKTTVTVGLGSTFASLRGDNVVALDANPDFGTLAERVPQQTASTVRDLLAAGPRIERYSDIRVHTSQAPSRLEVIAGERDPAASEAFTESDYRGVIELLRVHYNLILTDCGTGIMHSAMNGVLSLAHSLVLVSSPAVDGARSAAATLDWLGLHGYSHLVERTVVVVSAHRPGAASIDMDELTRHFLSRCRAVVVIPFDEHLAEGSIVDLEKLRPRTRRAFLELAAMVADDFPDAGGRHSGV